MKIKIEDDLYNRYMIIEQEVNIEDDYFIKMLHYENISGILKVEKRVINNKSNYYYDISNKQSLEDIRALRAFEYQDIIKIISGILTSLELIGQYLLIEDELFINEKSIFLSDSKTYLTYLPGYKLSIKESFTALIEYLMNNINYKDQKGVLLIYEIYAIIKEDFKLDLIKSKVNIENKEDDDLELTNYKENKKEEELVILEENLQEIYAEKAAPLPIIDEQVISDKEEYVFSKNQYIYSGISIFISLLIIVFSVKLGFITNRVSGRIEIEKGLLLLLLVSIGLAIVNFRVWNKANKETKMVEVKEYDNLIQEDEEIYEDNETCLLQLEVRKYGYYLKEKESKEIIIIEKFPFTIGKYLGQVDLYIDNNTISRYHARIDCLDSNIYLTDLNSTNGSKVNDNVIEPYTKAEIKADDKLTFANLEYILVKG